MLAHNNKIKPPKMADIICGGQPLTPRSNHLNSSHKFMKLLLRDWPLAPRHNYLTNHDEEDDKDEEEEDDYHDDD